VIPIAACCWHQTTSGYLQRLLDDAWCALDDEQIRPRRPFGFPLALFSMAQRVDAAMSTPQSSGCNRMIRAAASSLYAIPLTRFPHHPDLSHHGRVRTRRSKAPGTWTGSCGHDIAESEQRGAAGDHREDDRAGRRCPHERDRERLAIERGRHPGLHGPPTSWRGING
jgi:hypothetical protein